MGLLEDNVPEKYTCYICQDPPGTEIFKLHNLLMYVVTISLYTSAAKIKLFLLHQLCLFSNEIQFSESVTELMRMHKSKLWNYSWTGMEISV